MTLFGPDGSHWQKGIKLTAADWDAADFVIWRCVDEAGRLDDTWLWARDQAIARGKPLLAYSFLSADPRDLDEAVARTIIDTTIPVMADWEKTGCTFDEMLTWVHDLREKGYRVPLLYTGKGFWQANGSPRLTGYGFDLVVARYGGQKDDGQYEIGPRYTAMNGLYGAETWGFNLGGLRPVFWQYGSRIRWGDRFMDMNAYRGDFEDLSQWFRMPPRVDADHGVFTPPAAAPAAGPPSASFPWEEDDMHPTIQAQDATGQLYVTNRVGWARKLTEAESNGLRAIAGLEVVWPLNDPVEAAYIARIAS